MMTLKSSTVITCAYVVAALVAAAILVLLPFWRKPSERDDGPVVQNASPQGSIPTNASSPGRVLKSDEQADEMENPHD